MIYPGAMVMMMAEMIMSEMVMLLSSKVGDMSARAGACDSGAKGFVSWSRDVRREMARREGEKQERTRTYLSGRHTDYQYLSISVVHSTPENLEST